MRRAGKNSSRLALALAICGLLLSFVIPAQARAAAANGLTITPATLTLSLAKGQQTQQASLNITNHYATVVALSFALAQPVATPGAQSALKQLSVTPTQIEIAPGATV